MDLNLVPEAPLTWYFVVRYSKERLWGRARGAGETDDFDAEYFEIHQLATPFQVSALSNGAQEEAPPA